MKLSDLLLEGSDTHPEGVMVGFWVPPSQARLLAVPGGEPPEELHLTLAYLGKGLQRSQVQRLGLRCAAYAALHPPLAGRVVATGRFEPSVSSDNLEVLYARPEVPGLLRFREGLVRELERAGGKVSRNFEYNPHITLAYLQPGALWAGPVYRVPLLLRELVLAVGHRRRAYPLGPEY